MRLATVATHIFIALIGQIGEGSESEFDNLFVEWVELTESRNLEEAPPKQNNISLKGAVGRDHLADSVSHLTFISGAHGPEGMR